MFPQSKPRGEERYRRLTKGDEVGMFKSGSTVILLFDKKYKLAESLKKNKQIRVGEKIGIYS